MPGSSSLLLIPADRQQRDLSTAHQLLRRVCVFRAGEQLDLKKRQASRRVFRSFRARPRLVEIEILKIAQYFHSLVGLYSPEI